MTSLEDLIGSIRHSPRLPEIIELLRCQLDEERRRRPAFYKEMTPEQKIEFINGEAILHSPSRNRHLDVTGWIANLVGNFARVHKVGTVNVEKCLCVFPRNDYEPNIVFFGREKSASFDDDTLKFPVPDLVVEILSPSTEERDRGVKFEDYAANGVGEYWIVDADASVIEQYILNGESYELRQKSSSGRLRSHVLSGFECEVAAFFDVSENLAALRQLLST